MKVDMEQEQQQQHVIVESQEVEKIEEVKPQKTKRVASLDIFRGLTVAVSLAIFLFLWPSLLGNFGAFQRPRCFIFLLKGKKLCLTIQHFLKFSYYFKWTIRRKT